MISVSCNTIKLGSYKSTCTQYHQAELILDLQANNLFSYRFANNPNLISGSWFVVNDTLILKSGHFKTLSDTLFPITKMTDFPNQDKYLIKDRKLFILNKEGKSNVCFLKNSK